VHLCPTYNTRAVGLLAYKLTPEQVSIDFSDSYSREVFFRGGYQLSVSLALNAKPETKQEPKKPLKFSRTGKSLLSLKNKT